MSVARGSDHLQFLARAALARLRLLLPVLIFGVVASLAASGPAKVPLPPPVLVVNGVALLLAAVLLVLARRDRIPLRWAHPAAALTTLIPPSITITGQYYSGIPWMAMLVAMELAVAAMQISTRWMVLTVIVIAGAWSPLAFRDAGDYAVMQLSCVLGTAVIALVGHIAIVRSMLEAERSRMDERRVADSLAEELAERVRADAERGAIRDQLDHAQRLDAIGTLAAGLAHDMNNILSGISSFAELIGETTSEDATRNDCAAIVAEAERGGLLTRSLLAFSRRGQYRREPVRIDTIFLSVRPLLTRTLPKAINVEYRGEVDALVDADSVQLGQVLVNLCLNSADAMPDGGDVTISVGVRDFDGAAAAARTLPNPGRWVTIEVVDTGCGMTDEVREHVFEPFFTTKPIGKGTGLGMAMVYGAVHGHGGAIDIASRPDAGTTVTVYLPVHDGTTPARVTVPRSDRLLLYRLVLVVDDEPMIRASTQRMLERIGLRTIAAVDGAHALELFEAHRSEIALVILDMAMPRMGGAECFRRIRALAPRVPIVVASGYAAERETQELLATPNCVFLEKPYGAQALREHVHKLLAPSSPSSEARSA